MPTIELVSLPDQIFYQKAIVVITNTPPASPVVGDVLIVGGTPTGDFAHHDDEIAMWDGRLWVFTVPTNPTIVYLESVSSLYLYRTSWAAL